MDKLVKLQKVAMEIMKKYGATFTGMEVEEEEGERIVFIGGRIPYEPDYMEKERAIKEEIEKSFKDFEYRIIVGLVPVHSSEEERIKVIKDLFKELTSV